MNETRDGEIEPPVVIIVKEPSRKAENRPFHAQLFSHVGERAILVVMVKKVLACVVRDVEIRVSVSIVVARNDSLAERGSIDSRTARYIREGSVAVIVKELAG